MNIKLQCIHCCTEQFFLFQDDVITHCLRKSIPLIADLECGNTNCGKEFNLVMTIKINKKEINQVSAQGLPTTEKK